MIRSLRFAIAAPLALALAACGSSDTAESADLEGDAIASVAAPAGTQWRDVAEETADGGTLIGNPDAPLKLVEYGSLTCPTCARFSVEGSEPLMEYVDSGRVSFELRQFAIHGPIDITLGRLTKCGAAESVIPLSDQVWANLETIMGTYQANAEAFSQAMEQPIDQRFVTGAERIGLLDFFAARGISEDQARTCLADTAAIEKAAEFTQRYGSEFDISGTPTFQLNGQTVDANTWSGLEPILQRAGAR